ncbi:hypothetical protein C2S51_031576 [Perilla frutescens var. frutescens]|nr:hypothetical protein C2S51_031576 [Perilla frutescens var. frutescens]
MLWMDKSKRHGDRLQNDVGSFIETVKDMKCKYLYELNNMPQLEEDEESTVVPIGGVKAVERLLLLSKFFKIEQFRDGLIIVYGSQSAEKVMEYFKTLVAVEKNAMIRIFLTTNLNKVAQLGWRSLFNSHTHTMEPLNEQESEDLLCIKVFGEEVEDFPPRLETAAKKIAKNCKGLPLMIVTVAHLLSIANKNGDPEFWNEVTENPYSDVMMDAHNQIAKVLFPVYDCFPQFSKMFYLYMAAFPQDSEIPASKLINMLTSEGFLKPETLHNFFHWNRKLSTIASTTVLISQRKSVDYRATKTCRLGIQIELTPSGDDDHDLNFGYIWKLKNLEILKYSSIVNPKVKYVGDFDQEGRKYRGYVKCGKTTTLAFDLN